LYEDDWVELIGDILADQIDERMDSEQLVFRHNSTEDDPL
jgi:hypothetical protein